MAPPCCQQKCCRSLQLQQSHAWRRKHVPLPPCQTNKKMSTCVNWLYSFVRMNVFYFIHILTRITHFFTNHQTNFADISVEWMLTKTYVFFLLMFQSCSEELWRSYLQISHLQVGITHSSIRLLIMSPVPRICLHISTTTGSVLPPLGHHLLHHLTEWSKLFKMLSQTLRYKTFRP